MSWEYHGWIVLGTLATDWDDGQWDRACNHVEQVLRELRSEEGHWARLSELEACPVTVSLYGYDVMSIDPAKNVLAKIAKICDAAYGELVICRWPGRGNLSQADRYVLTDGKVKPLAAS